MGRDGFCSLRLLRVHFRGLLHRSCKDILNKAELGRTVIIVKVSEATAIRP